MYVYTLLYVCMYVYYDTVVKENDGVLTLNYARLVINYTRRFSQTDPREALQYFYLLKVLPLPSQ